MLNNHILVALAHPDDESFGAGGTISKYTTEGIPVTYACATLGEMGRNMGTPVFANRETLPVLRKQELKEACSALGIKDLRMLGLRDKTLEFENSDIIMDMIYEILLEIKPKLVITFYPGLGVHPDHNTIGEATILAISKLPPELKPEIHCLAVSKNSEDVLGKPDIVRDVTPFIEHKYNALKAHRSQTEHMLASIKDPLSDQSEWAVRFRYERFWIY
ncbi:bacillithiol biosynthesis deacetylase BshB2 [Bacillus sp. HMF5848]|uniref:bacillithiol biosynthesis deacetylase BshB2 n=1 Tax=Bacillus sp. HMF5848 TaxID=2495421 RepID=UPI000F78C220|nr:bacillithiol biosynthesis deacetylase BshB2 [Bacillus sp. HMF5848]RSK27261.1 bacillithiol biosynthesis deacetylase BshB2 [Bacillus sp. HMF5848]